MKITFVIASGEIKVSAIGAESTASLVLCLALGISLENNDHDVGFLKA